MIENISNLIVAAAAVVGAIFAALIAGLAIWTFRDIRSRSRDVLAQILATVVVAVIPGAGILVYLMLRPRETLAEAYVRALEEESLLASIEHQEFCPSCGRRVDNDMQFCPACHTRLRNACPGCGRAAHLSWDLCPYCGTALTPELPAIRKPAKRHLPQPAGAQAALGAGQAPSAAVYSQGGEQPARLERPGVGHLLDRVGGVIEGVVDRFNNNRGRPQPDQAPEAVPPPASRSARGAGTPPAEEALE
jgi:RNA polymerase subunit RPABC4/transcription elongation factor Spt4